MMFIHIHTNIRLWRKMFGNFRAGESGSLRETILRPQFLRVASDQFVIVAPLAGKIVVAIFPRLLSAN